MGRESAGRRDAVHAPRLHGDLRRPGDEIDLYRAAVEGISLDRASRDAEAWCASGVDRCCDLGPDPDGCAGITDGAIVQRCACGALIVDGRGDLVRAAPGMAAARGQAAGGSL